MKKKSLDPKIKDIRMNVLEELKSMLESNPMPIEKKKVTVVAKDEEGLEAGLKKAKDLISADDDVDMDDEIEGDDEGKMEALKMMLKKKKEEDL